MEKRTFSSLLHTFLLLTGLALSIVLVLSLFQYLISWIEAFLEWDIPATPWIVILYGLGIVLLSLVEYRLLTPTFGKGNVASLIVLLERREKVPVFKGLLSVFLCCLISFLIGVPLGGEGPSVFLGALIGEGLFLHTESKEKGHLAIAIGAATGFGSAFLNPLAGFFYFLEHQKEKKAKTFLMAGYVLLLTYFGMALIRFLEVKEDFFHYNLFQSDLVLLSSYEKNLFFLVIPFVAFFLAMLFKKAVLAMRNTYKPDERKIFLLSTIMALVVVLLLKFTGHSALLGIGTNLIHAFPSLGVEDALLFLFVRFLFSVMAFDSFYAGGQVLPTLAVGYLLGLLLSALFNNVLPLEEEEQSLLALVTMLTFYASVFDSYWTTLALAFSFGPFKTMLLPSLFSLFIVYLLDRHLWNTKSLSREIVEYDKKINESEPKLTY